MEKRYNTKHQFPSRFFRKILAISPFNHEKSKTEKRAEPQISSPLESALPPELLLMIINKLDIIDQVCLQSTNRFFHHFIKVDPILLNNKCRKWEIYCRFEQDLDYLPAKLACAFCKTIRKKKCFRDHKEVRLFDFGSLSLRLTHNGKECYPSSTSRTSPCAFGTTSASSGGSRVQCYMLLHGYGSAPAIGNSCLVVGPTHSQKRVECVFKQTRFHGRGGHVLKSSAVGIVGFLFPRQIYEREDVCSVYAMSVLDWSGCIISE